MNMMEVQTNENSLKLEELISAYWLHFKPIPLFNMAVIDFIEYTAHNLNFLLALYLSRSL